MIINDIGEQEPFQAFAAISENVLNKKVTGLVDGQRIYELPKSIKGEWDFTLLTRKASQIGGFARLFFEVDINPNGKYDIVIRSVNSSDARTASVTNLSFKLITDIKNKLFELPETKTVFYDVTPKPPATIEYV